MKAYSRIDLSGGNQMDNERKSCKTDFPSTISETEKEKYEGFISVMVQIVEKYGKIVLQELNHVA